MKHFQDKAHEKGIISQKIKRLFILCSKNILKCHYCQYLAMFAHYDNAATSKTITKTKHFWEKMKNFESTS